MREYQYIVNKERLFRMKKDNYTGIALARTQ